MRYIPAEKLIAEIERRIKAYDDIHEKKELDDLESMHAVELSRELENLLSFIESLEKEQPDLDAVSYCFDKGINISPRQATAIATHFYSLGQLRSISGPKIKGLVARDEDGTLLFGRKRPDRIRSSGTWMGFGQCMRIDRELYPDLRWEDEPKSVELIIQEVK